MLYIPLSLFVIVLNFRLSIDNINNAKSSLDLSVFILHTLTTGLFEELFLRILVFGELCRFFYKENKSSYYKEIVLSSLLFGLLHLTNGMFYDSQSLLTQVVGAVFLGILFQALLIRFNNIYLIATLHGLINFNGTFKLYFKILPESGTLDEPYNSTDYTFHIIIVSVILLISYFLTKKGHVYLKRTNAKIA